MKKGKTYGDGSISFDKSRNTYVGRIYMGRGIDGKSKRKTVYGKTKNEVKQKLMQIKMDIYTGDFLEDSQITIYHLGKQMIEDNYNLGKIKQGTYYRNKETLKRLEKIYHIPIQECTFTQVKNFLLSETGYSQSVINKEYIMIKGIFKEALKRGIIKNNIMLDIEKPRSKKEEVKVRGLTMDERKT